MFTKLKNFDSTKKIYNWLEFRHILVELILILCLGIIIHINFSLKSLDNFSLFIGGICLYLFYLWDKREKPKDEERFFLKIINLYVGDKISLHLKKREKDGELIELSIHSFKMKLDDESIFSAPWSTLKDNKFYLIRSKDDKKSVETVRINCYLDSTKDEDFLEFYTRVEFIKKLDIDGRLAMKKRLEEKIQADSSLEGVKVIYGFSNFDKITYHATILVNRENYEAMSKKLNSLTWSTIDKMMYDKDNSCQKITN